MFWTKEDAYYIRSDRGYFISASRSGAGWVYTAWSPPAAWWEEYREWEMGKRPSPPTEAGVKVRYEMGERVPAKRECLGVSHDVGEAKALCMQHMRRRDNDISPAA